MDPELLFSLSELEGFDLQPTCEPQTTIRRDSYHKTCLSEYDLQEFQQIYFSLLIFVAQKLNYTFPVQFQTLEDFKAKISEQEKTRISELAFANLSLWQTFIDLNPANLSHEMISIVALWKEHALRSFFLVERHLTKGSIFIQVPQAKTSFQEILPSTFEDMPTYLVVGVDKPMVDIIDKNQLPVMIKCSLLPFRDKIVCDGFIEKFEVVVPSKWEFTESLKEAYMKAKQQKTILTQLGNDNFTGKRKRKNSKDKKDPKKLSTEILQLSNQLKKISPKGTASSVASVLTIAAQLMEKTLAEKDQNESVEKGLTQLKNAVKRI